MRRHEGKTAHPALRAAFSREKREKGWLCAAAAIES
jgi:hypothetical protein